MFIDPQSGGDKVFKVWQLVSKGNLNKYNQKGWFAINDNAIIFNQKKFTVSQPGCHKNFIDELSGPQLTDKEIRSTFDSYLLSYVTPFRNFRQVGKEIQNEKPWNHKG